MPLQSIVIVDLRDIRPIAVSTIDSGVQFFYNGNLWSSIPSPVRTLPVHSIVPFRTYSSLRWTETAAATDSGVFYNCPPNADCMWIKIPGLTGSPKFLAQYQGKMLWAGTDSGVYLYESTTTIERENLQVIFPAINLITLRHSNGNAVFEIKNTSGREGNFSFFDMQGRCVKTLTVRGRDVSIANMNNGVYIYRITLGEQTVRSGKAIIR